MSSKPLLMEYNRLQSDQACPLCGAHTYEGEPCGSCYVPFRVIESIRSRPYPPKFVGVLGSTGVGKTVYLGMLLDLLARGVGGLQGMSRSPYSLTLHRNLVLALERQRFPAKTPVESDRWNWMHCEVLTPKSRNAFDVVTPDVAGEAVTHELENPGSNKTIRALIGRCSGMVVLVDLVQVVAEGQREELFAMQLISYLDALRPGKKKSRKVDVPVAIVFTKADLFEEWLDDPDGFARSNASGLFAQCQSRLERFASYCSGVAGSSANLIKESGQESLIPLRGEPRGIVEPFSWMLNQLR
jgi:hypothetical protein